MPGLPSDAHAKLLAPVELSIRRTRPVAAALAAAATPVPYSFLLRGLAELFPAARPDQLSSLLADLLSQHILISSLWPPMTCTAPNAPRRARPAAHPPHLAAPPATRPG